MNRSVTAPVKTAQERKQRALLLTLGVATFVVGLDGRIVAPLLPSIAQEFGTSLSVASYSVSLYLLPYGLFQLAYGPLADRFGKVRVASYAMIVFSLGTAVCGAFPSLAALLSLRALTGAAAAALIPLSIAYIGDTVPYAKRQAALGLLMASGGAAQSLGAGLGGMMAQIMSWRHVFPVLGGLSALVTLTLFRAARRADGPRVVVTGGSYWAALSSPLRTLLWLVLVEGALFMGCFPFMSGLLEQRFRSSALQIGLVLGAAGLAQVAIASAIRWLVARLGEERSVLFGGLAMAASYLVCSIASHALWVALAASLLGAGFSLCHSTLQARATEAFPSGRGRSLALFAFSLFAGGGLGTFAMAALTTRAGYAPSFAAAGVAFAVFAIVASRAVSRRASIARGIELFHRSPEESPATAQTPRSKSRWARPCPTRKRLVPSSSARPSAASGSGSNSVSGKPSFTTSMGKRTVSE